jgi:Xaa-Pro aminopeptidase
MAERNIDAIIVEGPDGLASVNSDYNYFVGGRKITGIVLKKRDEPAMLVYGPMERQQAAETGLVLIPRDRWNIREIAQEFPDPFAAQVEYRRQMFTDLGITGRVGMYGTVQAGRSFALLAALAQQMPDLEIVAEFERNLISAARLTKDPEEIEQMREVGRKTSAVVQAVVDFIKAGRAQGDTLVNSQGEVITIGHIHQLIRREVAAQGLEMPHGVIFAQGYDAGLPHAHGTETDPLKLGLPIVFDIYPRAPGGYYHDMTRTFAIGYATPELQRLYEDVRGAFEQVVGELETNAPTYVYQKLVCDYFEARGHATVATRYPLEEGYVHSLGHGLGLEVHEDLKFAYFQQQDRGDTLAPGSVFAIEPGLYYPSRNLGVRIEDTFYSRPDGTIESLTPFPIDLVIPLEGAE